LQEARQLKEQKRSAEALEHRVAERTAELLLLKDELAAELAAMKDLHALSTRLLAKTELQSLLDEILSATIVLQKADFGNIQLYNAKTRALEIAAHRGFRQDFLDHFASVQDDGAACGRAMSRRERIIIEDVLIDPAFEPNRAIAASAGFRAVQSTPLFSRSGEPLGMISTHFRKPHRPQERELRLTDLYARQATELIERKRADEALRASEERFRHIVEGVKDYAIYMVDLDGRVITWNNGAERMKGYSSQEILGQHFSLLYEPRDVESGKPERGLEEAAAAGRFEDEGWRVRKDGSRFRANVITTALKDEAGKLRGFVNVTRDMSERRRAEEALRASEERFRRYFELGLIGMAMTSPTKGCLEVNDELCRILGYERDELLQKTPDDLAADVAQFNRVVAGEVDGYTMDKRWIRKDGRVIDSIMAARCLRRADGSVDYFVEFVLDTTERRRAEETFRESEHRFSVVFDKASFAVALAKLPEGTIVDVNPAWVEMFGFAREQALGRTSVELGIDRDLERRRHRGSARRPVVGDAE
jgi:PAS domain S-box-containing protein